MRRILGLALLCVIAYGTSVCFAEEEIFDIKAAAAHIEKGIHHLKAKKYDAAISEFEEAAAIHPEAEPFYYLGYAYYLKGKAGDEESRQKAIENFGKAYDLDPNFTPTKLKPAEQDAIGQGAQGKTVEESAPGETAVTEQPAPSQH